MDAPIPSSNRNHTSTHNYNQIIDGFQTRLDMFNEDLSKIDPEDIKRFKHKLKLWAVYGVIGIIGLYLFYRRFIKSSPTVPSPALKSIDEKNENSNSNYK